MVAYVYLLQQPFELKSLENLKEVFQIERAQSNQSAFFNNCLIFYTLLTLEGNDKIVSYIQKDRERKQLIDLISKLDYFSFGEVDC